MSVKVKWARLTNFFAEKEEFVNTYDSNLLTDFCRDIEEINNDAKKEAELQGALVHIHFESVMQHPQTGDILYLLKYSFAKPQPNLGGVPFGRG